MDRRRLIPGLVALGLALATAGGIALAADITCTARSAATRTRRPAAAPRRTTSITGSPQRDNVVAGKGNDVVNGLGGMDFLQGQKGDDDAQRRRRTPTG